MRPHEAGQVDDVAVERARHTVGADVEQAGIRVVGARVRAQGVRARVDVTVVHDFAARQEQRERRLNAVRPLTSAFTNWSIPSPMAVCSGVGGTGRVLRGFGCAARTTRGPTGTPRMPSGALSRARQNLNVGGSVGAVGAGAFMPGGGGPGNPGIWGPPYGCIKKNSGF